VFPPPALDSIGVLVVFVRLPIICVAAG
jgi:hypothetical protein